MLTFFGVYWVSLSLFVFYVTCNDISVICVTAQMCRRTEEEVVPPSYKWHHIPTKTIFHITKFTLSDRIYPIECTYIKIECILWPRQILRAVKARAKWQGKEPCSFRVSMSFFAKLHVSNITTVHLPVYEDYSKSSVMNGFPYARTMYAWLILCINILHYIIHAHVKFRRNRANSNKVIGL